MKKSVIIAHIVLFLANLFYAINYTVAKEVMPDFIQPFGFILLRVSIALVLFCFLHRWMIAEQVARGDYLLLAICGLFGVAVNQLMFFKGLNWTTPINASLIIITTPIFVLVGSTLVLGEGLTIRRALGIVLGGIGATVLILYGQSVPKGTNGLLGDLFILVNACSYAIYLVLVKSLLEKYHPLTVVRWVYTFGLVLVIPFGLHELRAIEWSTFTAGIWYSVAFVVVGATFLAFLFNAYAIKILNPTILSTYIYAQPLLATMIALVFAKDVLTLEKILAGGLIFAGVFLVSFQPKGVLGDRAAG